MSNNKSLKERLSSIRDRGPDKWLTRSLFEGRAEEMNRDHSIAMGGSMAPTEAPKDPVVPTRPAQMNVSSGAEGGSGGPPTNDVNEVSEQNSERHGRHLNDRQQQIQGLKRQLRESFNNEEAEVEPHIKGLRDSISGLLKNRVKGGDGSETAMRNQFITLAALAQSYDGKVRHGEGKRSMFYEDAQMLLNEDNQKMLREGYGDGSPEQIKKFVASRKSVDTPKELVEQIYKQLPKQFVDSILTSGNMGTSLDVLDEDTGEVKGQDVSKLHYGGEGKRGGHTNKQRKLHLLKLLLDQMGRDGYTGNLLDPRYMELEHVRGLQNVRDGEDGVTLDQLKEREHPDNHLWIGTGVNNEKSDQDMDSFLDGVNERHGDKGKQDYVSINTLDEGDKHYLETQDARASLIEDKIQDEMFTEDVDAESIQALFDNELAESTEMGKNGIKKTPVGIADKLRKALGLVKDRKVKRSQLKTDKEMFIPIIMNMANASPKRREEIKTGYTTSFNAAADRIKEMRESASKDPDGIYKKDGKLNESGTFRKLLYSALKEQGIISNADLKKYLQEPDQKRFKQYFEGFVIDLDLVM